MLEKKMDISRKVKIIEIICPEQFLKNFWKR
jgi:hypothetical protein